MSTVGIDWGSLADWASATGSVLASGLALYLSKSAQRVSVTAFCGIRVITGTHQATLASIHVTNTGERPFRVATISLSHGLIRKQHGIIKMDQPTIFSDRLMVPLNDGDSAHYGFLLDEDNWVSQEARTFRNALDIKTFRVTLHFSNSQRIRIKPEKPLLDHMKGIMKQARRRTKAETDPPDTKTS